MGNCLVTELKASVNNSELRVFDRVRYTFTPSTASERGADLKVVDGETVTVRILDDVHKFTNGKSSVTITGAGSTAKPYYVAKADDTTPIDMAIDNAHNLLQIVNFNYLYFDYNDYINCSLITAAQGNGFGNIENLYKNTSLSEINCASNANITGELHTLGKKMVERGRTSGNLYIYATGTGVTQNGTVITRSKKITFDSSLEDGYSISNL